MEGAYSFSVGEGLPRGVEGTEEDAGRMSNRDVGDPGLWGRILGHIGESKELGTSWTEF